jgi:hypothetical protein
VWEPQLFTPTTSCWSVSLAREDCGNPALLEPSGYEDTGSWVFFPPSWWVLERRPWIQIEVAGGRSSYSGRSGCSHGLFLHLRIQPQKNEFFLLILIPYSFGEGGSTGLWTQSLALARQVHYHLSYFLLYYFPNRVLCFCLECPRPQSSYLYLPTSWDDKICATTPSLLLRWCHTNFLLSLASNYNPLNLHLPSCCGYRYEPPCLAFTSSLSLI